MANLYVPYPHKNTRYIGGTSKLKSVAMTLTLPTDLDKQLPVNKYRKKYSFGTKTLVLKPAYVYYIRISFADGLVVYKIGYTSCTVRRRIDFFGLSPSTKVEILETIKCKNSKLAFLVEQALHREFAGSRYKGKDLIASGNTELYAKALV